MYGRYTKDLGEYAKDEARRLKQLERQRKKDDRARDKVNRNEIDNRGSNEYKATVLGTFRNFSENGEGGKSSRQFRGAGVTHLLEWERIGYS